MKARLERDLQALEEETSQHEHLVERRLVGVEVGNLCAFVNFQLWVNCGPFAGCRLNVVLKTGANYPYDPPQVFCHDKGFFHPNQDLVTNQMMFSLVDQKFWKPTFELAQVLCGVEMILLEPEPGYATVRGAAVYAAALREGVFQKSLAGGMQLEGERGGVGPQTALCLAQARGLASFRDHAHTAGALGLRQLFKVKTIT